MQFKDRFEAGEFACLVQIEPPKGADVSAMVSHVMGVKGEVDAFLVPEMGNAVMRMSSLGAALILRAGGVDTIIQVNCRDRNRLALQGDLLAAAASGITSLMVVTGEDPSFGDHHTAKAVYDLDLDTLLTGVSAMEAGRDMAGVELQGAPSFLKGTILNTCLRGGQREEELDRMKRMADNGIRFFITQPLFEFSMTQPFQKTAEKLGVKLLPTVLHLKSLGMARYMARNVDQVNMPDEVVKRILKSSDKVRECTRLARDTIKAVQAEGFGGVNVSTLGWEHKLPELLGVVEGLNG